MTAQPDQNTPRRQIYEVEYVVRQYRKIVVAAVSEAEAIAKAQRAQKMGADFEIEYDDSDDWRAEAVQP